MIPSTSVLLRHVARSAPGPDERGVLVLADDNPQSWSFAQQHAPRAWATTISGYCYATAWP